MVKRGVHPVLSRSRGFGRAEGGAAAAEMVLWITVMILPVLNVVDIGTYMYQRMMVEMAASNGINAIRRICSSYATPLTQNCPGITAAVTTAAQTTPLGTDITVVSGYPTEGYYCVNGSNALVQEPSSTVGTVGSPPTKASPFDCSSVGGNTSSPGAYMQVSVTYSYQPIFTGISAASLLTTPIVRTSWVRVG
jgi:Flp pilus assembly protein TadG